MCINRIRNKFSNFNWKKALISTLIPAVLILGVGLPFFAPHGFVAFLSWSSIVIVLFAIWISIQSLNMARDTQRPFLNVLETVHYSLYPASIQKIAFSICNKGVFPAEEVLVHCDVCHNKENAENHSLSLEKEIPSIYFPNEEIKHIFEEKKDDKNQLEIKSGNELRVQITISYKNKLTQKKHKTVRSYLMRCNPPEEKAILIPLPKGDYWD